MHCGCDPLTPSLIVQECLQRKDQQQVVDFVVVADVNSWQCGQVGMRVRRLVEAVPILAIMTIVAIVGFVRNVHQEQLEHLVTNLPMMMVVW